MVPHLDPENRRCALCYEDMKENGEPLWSHQAETNLNARIQKVFHTFHTTCAAPWIEIEYTCPLCRIPVDLKGLIDAARHGWIETVQTLLDNEELSEEACAYAIVIALEHHHWDIADLILEYAPMPEDACGELVIAATKVGHLNMVNQLLDVISEEDCLEAIESAENHPQILKRLLDRLCVLNPDLALTQAIRHGFIPFVKNKVINLIDFV